MPYSSGYPEESLVIAVIVCKKHPQASFQYEIVAFAGIPFLHQDFFFPTCCTVKKERMEGKSFLSLNTDKYFCLSR